MFLINILIKLKCTPRLFFYFAFVLKAVPLTRQCKYCCKTAQCFVSTDFKVTFLVCAYENKSKHISETSKKKICSNTYTADCSTEDDDELIQRCFLTWAERCFHI